MPCEPIFDDRVVHMFEFFFLLSPPVAMGHKRPSAVCPWLSPSIVHGLFQPRAYHKYSPWYLHRVVGLPASLPQVLFQ